MQDQTQNIHGRDQQKVDAAKTWVDNNFTKASVWRGGASTPSDIQKDRELLKGLITDPQRLDQYSTNTCGPAAFWYLMAYYRPEDFAKAVTELYYKGETELGSMKLKPGKKILESWDTSGTLVGLLDWIALVSLKNHTSSSYNNPKDQFSAMTLPGEMRGWLTDSGSSVVNIQTSIASTKDLANLRDATVAFEAGSMVCLFVKAKSMTRTKKTWWGGVDHWVVQVNPVMVRQTDVDPWVKLTSVSGKTDEELLGYQIKLGFYSWGAYWVVQPSGQTTAGAKTVGEWLKYYYGYVAARV